MQKEFLHLSYLLTKHECVIVPGVGAFVAYSDPLTFNQAAGTFHAPAKSLGFNPELKHNDGLLIHSIMMEQQISYNEANLHVLRFAEELTNHLKVKREVNIPGLGQLRFSSESKIAFYPEEFPVSNAINYGLSYFQTPLLSDLEKQGKIGSGAIESAHRTVIQKRMKLSGQHWSSPGSENMLRLRVIAMNKQWHKVIDVLKNQNRMAA